ncbi:hypothetical protein HKX48_003973 [Thoreauomyces humboldtii]|nr:hypothetical protein HKX48_003973 [Thoreauomyces humboldtii]
MAVKVVSGHREIGESFTSDQPALTYKKWAFQRQKTILDLISCGPAASTSIVSPAFNPVTGQFASTRQSARYIGVGSPMITFYGTSEASRSYSLKNVANKVTSAVTSAVFSFAKTIWTHTPASLTGAIASASTPPSPKRAQPEPPISGSNGAESQLPDNVAPPVVIPALCTLSDPNRQITSVVPSPRDPVTGHSTGLAAMTDNLGRVLLVDVREGEIVRVWKGMRGAQVGWVQDEGVGEEPQGLILAMYAARGALELYTVRHGPRIAAFAVGVDMRLLQCGGGVLGGAYGGEAWMRGGGECEAKCLLRNQRRLWVLLLTFLAVLALRRFLRLEAGHTHPKCACLPAAHKLDDILENTSISLDQGPVIDWKNMGGRARTFRALMEARYTPEGHLRRDCESNGTSPLVSEIIARLDEAKDLIEEDLYPFVFSEAGPGSTDALLRSFNGRGIVMTTGNHHALMALHAIRGIRRVGSTLPIQVFYQAEEDLTLANRQLLSAEVDVEVVDISTLLDIGATDPDGVSDHRLGWGLKPFAMLASRFSEVVLVDADALFLQNPEVMFSYPLYVNSGALLFRDRTLFPGHNNTRDFFEGIMEDQPPSIYWSLEGRIGRGLSVHEGESGVVVLDKRRNFHALLMTCKMNSGHYKHKMYAAVHGDKESYWMAHELTDTPYRWAPGGGGTLGFLEPTDEGIRVCGQLFHVDASFRPLWGNGGMTSNKNSHEGGETIRFTHWATDRDFIEVKWDWEKADKPFCLHRDVAQKGVQWNELGQGDLETLAAASDDWKKLQIERDQRMKKKKGEQ